MCSIAQKLENQNLPPPLRAKTTPPTITVEKSKYHGLSEMAAGGLTAGNLPGAREWVFKPIALSLRSVAFLHRGDMLVVMRESNLPPFQYP
jgi:hypothetical protein